MTNSDFLKEIEHHFTKCPIRSLEKELKHYSEKGDNLRQIEMTLALVKQHEEVIRSIRQKIEEVIRENRFKEWMKNPPKI